MKYLILLAFVIYITSANSEPSRTSEQNSTEGEIHSETTLQSKYPWLYPRKMELNENANRALTLKRNAFLLVDINMTRLVDQVRSQVFQSSKLTLEQRFRERFPQCKESVIKTMLQDVPQKMTGYGVSPCWRAGNPMTQILLDIFSDATEYVKFFNSDKYKTANATEINDRIKNMENMEKQVTLYQNSDLKSEERNLTDCYKNFIIQTMDQWNSTVVPEDKCKTVEDYNALFNNTDVETVKMRNYYLGA